MKYTLKNGESIVLADGTFPYDTCHKCPVFDRCQRVKGTAPLPADYHTNTECMGYLMVTRSMELTGLPVEYHSARKETYQFNSNVALFESYLRDTFNRTKDMVANGSNMAFMSADKGTGKTYTAATILNEYVIATAIGHFDYERPVARYLKYSAWANELRKMYRINDDDFSEQLLADFEHLKEVPLLVIDDIGSGRMTNFITDYTYELIDYRKENKKSTIFTTNLTRDQLNSQECLGDIITSRLFYNTVIYDISGVDLRGAKSFDVKQQIMQKRLDGGQ